MKWLKKNLCWCTVSFRKIPWIHVETEDPHEKDPEVISTVGQNDAMSKVKLSEFPSQKELMEKELEGRSRGNQFQTFTICSFVQHTVLKHYWKKYRDQFLLQFKIYSNDECHKINT